MEGDGGVDMEGEGDGLAVGEVIGELVGGMDGELVGMSAGRQNTARWLTRLCHYVVSQTTCSLTGLPFTA